MAAEALQALNRILQYQQQRDRSDVQEALGLMEFAAKKRVSDYNLASKMIEDSSKYNSQLQIKVAQDFIKNSNLDQFYNAMTIDKELKYEEVQDEIGIVAKDLRNKQKFKGVEGKGTGVTFSKLQSEEIASALWAFKTTQDPSAVMSLADDIRGVNDMEN
jgi:DNA-binding Xre family transcriptional regulator